MQLSIKNVEIIISVYKLYIYIYIIYIYTRKYTATYSLGKYNSKKRDREQTVRM